MSNPKYTLEKLANHAIIDTGFPFKSEYFTNDSNDIPLVKGENLQQGYIDWDNAKYWSRYDVQDYNKYWLQPDDVVLAMDRPWVQSGLKWSYIKRHYPKAFLVQRVARLRAKKTVHQKFLRCLIGNEYFSGYIQPIVTGVNVPHISAKQIGDFFISVPPFLDQVKIAAIVSAYDDLIENNDRRITLLEKMAEEIYREWFVRLRFPGFDRVTFHKGIPEGWEIKDIADTDIAIIDGDRGNNYPRKDEFSEYGYCLFLNTGNIKSDRFDFSNNDFVTEQKDSLLRKGKLTSNDIILTTRGTIGSVAFYSTNSFYKNVRINSGMVVLRSKNGKDDSLYYYYLFKSSLLKEKYFLYSSGAAQPQLPIKDLKRISILIPSKDVLKQFCQFVGLLNERIDNLQLKNWNLKQTRDRLLTRLISGKLSVEDLDIQFPPSMIEETTPTK